MSPHLLNPDIVNKKIEESDPLSISRSYIPSFLIFNNDDDLVR
jgi:hypothetical protein